MKKLLLSLAAILFLPVSAYAQTPSPTVLVSPVKSVVSGTPGEKVNVVMTVENSTNASMTASVVANDFIASDKLDGEPRLLIDGTTTTKFGLSAWLTSKKSIVIGAKKKVEYTATFSVPANAESRTYFGAIRFVPAGQTSGQTTSVGSLVFITVGQANPNVAISDLKYDEPTTDKPNGSFTAKLTNSGAAIYTQEAVLTVKDNNGQTLAELKPDVSGSVLPESARIFSYTPKQALPKQNMTALLKAPKADGTKDASKDLLLNFAPPAASTPTKPTAKKSPLLLYTGIGAGALVLIILLAVVIAKKRKSGSPAPSLPATLPSAPTVQPTIQPTAPVAQTQPTLQPNVQQPQIIQPTDPTSSEPPTDPTPPSS